MEYQWLYEKIKEVFREKGQDKIIEDITVGLGYTYVDTGGANLGFAYTFRFDTEPTCSPLREAGTLKGQRAINFIKWIDTFDTLKIAVALATFNSLLSIPEHYEADITELEEVQRANSIGMIGFFEPVVKKLEEKGKKVTVFEKQKYPQPDIYPDWSIPYKIKENEVVIITSTSLINKTLPLILSELDGGATAVLLGPTSPLFPELFKDTPIKYIAGSIARDKEKVKQIIREGAGSRVFGKSVKRIIVNLS